MHRYQVQEILDGANGDPDDFTPGLYYLVEITNTNERGCPTRYELRADPPRTNQSREPRPLGWCGTTNGTAVFGRGAVRVGRTPTGRVRITPATLAELAADEEVGS